MSHRRVSRAAVLSAVLLGCTEPGPVRVEVSPATSVIEVGGSLLLTARCYDGAGREVARAVAWWSDHPDVATVSSAGRVVGVGGGRATVTASVPGGVGAAEVAVVPAITGLWVGENADLRVSLSLSRSAGGGVGSFTGVGTLTRESASIFVSASGTIAVPDVSMAVWGEGVDLTFHGAFTGDTAMVGVLRGAGLTDTTLTLYRR